jgi:hypothetical protein
MLDVHLPTTDGRTLILSRYTELAADQRLLAKNIDLDLPPQPPPRITASGQLARPTTPPLMLVETSEPPSLIPLTFRRELVKLG